MIGFKEQLDLFKLIGEHLKNKIECIVIGGSAMLFYGMKSATKDIDLIFYSDNDRSKFSKILDFIGFEKRVLIKTKSKKRIPLVFERGEARFDLFSGGIFHLSLSPGIKERLKEKHEFKNLIVWIISPEDIILLKSVTDRAGDRLDTKNIIEKINIDWEIIIKEAQWQTENGDKTFSVYLFDFLEDLYEDFKAEIPKNIIRKVRKISEEEMIRVLKSRKGH